MGNFMGLYNYYYYAYQYMSYACVVFLVTNDLHVQKESMRPLASVQLVLMYPIFEIDVPWQDAWEALGVFMSVLKCYGYYCPLLWKQILYSVPLCRYKLIFGGRILKRTFRPKKGEHTSTIIVVAIKNIIKTRQFYYRLLLPLVTCNLIYKY